MKPEKEGLASDLWALVSQLEVWIYSRFPTPRPAFHPGDVDVLQAALETKGINIERGFILGASISCIDFGEKKN